MRPIVPCHSAIQNPAAVFAYKQLKPFLDERPYVLKGTKDLAIRLSKLKLKPYRSYFLVSFDIVAYYPNVPLDRCLEEVRTWWVEDWLQKQQHLDHMQRLQLRGLVRQALNIANKDLMFEFDGQIYKQLKGLAMGVASSPLLANLYAAFHEERNVRIALDRGDFAFFGRFIDDGLCIIYADSADEAILVAQQYISYPGLELTWDVSDRFMPFLDMLVYVEQAAKRLQWRPFRKARNNLERIPFASHHPLDVKRGTFLGEMSRMAVLSSSQENYLLSLTDLKMVYMNRGYPEELLLRWLKDNTAKRWLLRFEEPRVSHTETFGGRDKRVLEDTPLFLKTTFNPVWDAFNIQKLREVIVNTWSSHLNDVYHSRRQSFYYGDDESAASSVEDTGPDLMRTLPDLFNLVGPSRGLRTAAVIGSISRTDASQALEPLEPTPNAVVGFKEGDTVVQVEASTTGDGNSVLQLGCNLASLTFEDLVPLGRHTVAKELKHTIDVRKVGLTKARWLVSRKRTMNLADFLNKHKRALLDEYSEGKTRENYDKIVSKEVPSDAPRSFVAELTELDLMPIDDDDLRMSVDDVDF